MIFPTWSLCRRWDRGKRRWRGNSSARTILYRYIINGNVSLIGVPWNSFNFKLNRKIIDVTFLYNQNVVFFFLYVNWLKRSKPTIVSCTHELWQKQNQEQRTMSLKYPIFCRIRGHCSAIHLNFHLAYGWRPNHSHVYNRQLLKNLVIR